MSPLSCVAALVAMAFVAGCGGDDAPAPVTTTATGPPTKAQFLLSADQICHSFESQIEAAGDELFTRRNGPPPRRVRRFALRIAVPKLESEIDAVRSLGAPRGDHAEVRRILAASQEGVDQIRRRPERIAGGAAPPGLRRAGRLARAYGSHQCGAQ